MSEFAEARKSMVLSQLQPDRVSDGRIREAMADVPREKFVPDQLKSVSYVDEDIEIKSGRYLIEPRVFARLLQAAEVGMNEVVLDIGCGTGYSSAIISRLARTVVALESDQELRHQAQENLEHLCINNVAMMEGDLTRGFVDEAPYDIVFINGAVTNVPVALTEQMADGGRLVTVIKNDGVGSATLITVRDGQISSTSLFDAQVQYLIGFKSKAGFVF